MGKDSLINIIVEIEDANTKSILPTLAEKKIATVSLPVKKIKQNLKRFLDSLEEIITDANRPGKTMKVDQIELNFTVNAEGGIELIGKVSAGIETSIKIILVRSDK